MMTKDDRLANRDYADVVNELIAEGMIDILPKDILQRYLKSAVDQDGRHIPSGWACEIEENLLYIRGLVERYHKHNIVPVNLKYFRRRSKRPLDCLEEAQEYVRYSTNLRPIALHVVKDCENDFLWAAWIIDKKHRNSGAAASLVNHVDEQVEVGQLREETAVGLLAKPNPRIRLRNQELMNVLATSMTGPEQMRLIPRLSKPDDEQQ